MSIGNVSWHLSSDMEPYCESFDDLPKRSEIQAKMKEHGWDVAWLFYVTEDHASETIYEFTLSGHYLNKLDIWELREREKEFPELWAPKEKLGQTGINHGTPPSVFRATS